MVKALQLLALVTMLSVMQLVWRANKLLDSAQFQANSQKFARVLTAVDSADPQKLIADFITYSERMKTVFAKVEATVDKTQALLDKFPPEEIDKDREAARKALALATEALVKANASLDDLRSNQYRRLSGELKNAKDSVLEWGCDQVAKLPQIPTPPTVDLPVVEIPILELPFKL